MCERRYTPAAIAELQQVAGSEEHMTKYDPYRPSWFVSTPESELKSFRIDSTRVARYIAAQPPTQHERLVRQLLAALGRAGVDVEACECALDEATFDPNEPLIFRPKSVTPVTLVVTDMGKGKLSFVDYDCGEEAEAASHTPPVAGGEGSEGSG